MGFPVKIVFKTCAIVAAQLLLTAYALAGEIAPDRLRAHVATLASDEFGGRLAGSPVERKTIEYISAAFAAAGVRPLRADGAWEQPVPLMEAGARRSIATLSIAGKAVRVDQRALVLIGTDQQTRLDGAAVVFVGYGIVDPRIGRDDLAGADLQGKIVLRLAGLPPEYEKPGAYAPGFADRRALYANRGAIAELSINEGDAAGFAKLRQGYRQGIVQLDRAGLLAVTGQVRADEAARWLSASGLSLKDMKERARKASFRPIALEWRIALDVRSRIRRFRSANIVAQLPGSDPGGEAVMLSAHWDAFGICRPAGEADRICNGAIDNASGIAGLIELARALADGPKLSRSIIFLATTAEERGLLGAEYYAANPLFPLERTVGGFNLDTIALRPSGAKVGIIGRGLTSLDPMIARAAAAQGRVLLDDPSIQQYFMRSDQYALVKKGVPMVMVTGVFSREVSQNDPIDTYFATHYHAPGDELSAIPSFDGAAQDVELTLRLVRDLADQSARPAWLPDSPFQRPRQP